jgi:hypothetical protein
MNVPSEWPSEPCTFLCRLVSFIDDQRCRKPRRWRLMSVHRLCGTCCFLSLCWILECLGCCQIFGKYTHPCWHWNYCSPIRDGVFTCGPAQREWTVWTLIARVHWAPGLKCDCASWSGITMLGENIFFWPSSVVIFTIRQTQLCGSRIYGLIRHCSHRPSSGRVLVRRKVKRGDACPYRQQV